MRYLKGKLNYSLVLNVVIFTVLFTVFWWPFLSDNYLGPRNWDWQWFYKYLLFIKESWASNHLPVYDFRSISFPANGETSALYILNYLLRYFDVLTYIKINLCLHYIAGMAGLSLIFNTYKINKKFLIIAALLVLFNGNFVTHLYFGHYGWSAYLLLPLVYGLYLRRDNHWIFPISIGLLVSLALYEGGQHIVIWYVYF